ncbi:MAG: PEP/pyruvate-binding domain-containing protein [Promethearchaeia archaeon]
MFRLEELIQMKMSEIKKLNIGLKAENLVWIAKNSFSNKIPPFYVILPEECEKLLENNSKILDIRKEINLLSSQINTKFFFVRSSAQFEDKMGLPTAGLFLSLGKVSSENLERAIKKCIMSTRKKKIRKILGSYPSTAIIVQKMILSSSSGVLFTKDPILDDKSRIIIEAGFGLGETVVSGKFNIDHYEIDKENPNKVIKSQIYEKNHYISSQSNSIKNVPKSKRKKSVLSQNQLISLAKMALDLENLYRKAIDLEWTIDKGERIWFLQLRQAQ